MAQTPKPYEPHSGSRAAVENGFPVPTSSAEVKSREEADLIEVSLVLARGKKHILQITGAAALLATIVVLILPKTYTANATLLPPQQKQSALNSMLGQIGALADWAHPTWD